MTTRRSSFIDCTIRRGPSLLLSLGPSQRRPVYRCALIALVLLAAGDRSWGQTRRPGRPRAVPMARYVPASAKLFVSVVRLGDLDAALHRAHAWTVLPMMASGSGSSAAPTDLASTIKQFLGPHSAINLADLAKTEIGIVAPAWDQLSAAVWLVRMPDEGALDRWFPKAQRRFEGTVKPGMRYLRINDGMLVCVRDGIVAMARHRRSGELFRQTRRLMAGRNEASMAKSEVFRNLSAYLPARYLAYAFVDRTDQGSSDRADVLPAVPAMRQAVVGIYEGDGRLDVAVRGTLAGKRRRSRLSEDTVQRMMQLPQTTLFASATVIDFQSAYAEAMQRPDAGVLGRILIHLAGFSRHASAPAKLIDLLSGEVVFVWGQDLTGSGTTPQLALLVRTSNARALAAELDYVAESILKLIHVIDPVEDGKALALQRGRHLSARTTSVTLDTYAPASKYPLVKLLRQIRPCWAASGDWLIIALSPQHLERLLDSESGLMPPLEAVRDVRALAQNREDRLSLSVAQAGLASGVLDGWLGAYERQAPSLLDPSWWSIDDTGTAPSSRHLGIVVSDEPTPGRVVVADTRPGSPAADHLEPGDVILGVDGRLLSLETPAQDLWRRLAAHEGEKSPTLRVKRSDVYCDIVMTSPPARSGLAQLAIKPADAVRELASLAHTLRFASLSVFATRGNAYSARLSLRLEPKRSP